MEPCVEVMHIRPQDVSIDLDEARRYMGYPRNADTSDTADIIRRAHDEVMKALKPAASFLRTQIAISVDEVDMGCIRFTSSSLARNLSGCDRAFLFAATCGPMVDGLVARRQRFSLAEGAVYDAVASAAAEGVCNEVCRRLKEISCSSLRPRFSPGYGDLSIEVQPGFLGVLDAARKVGITLTDNFLMIPTKSVTAIVGEGVGNK